MGELGLSQRRAAAQLGISQQSLSDRTSGRIPWRLNELEAAAVTLEMDLTSILAPVDGDLGLSLFAPLDQADGGADAVVANIGADTVVAS